MKELRDYQAHTRLYFKLLEVSDLMYEIRMGACSENRKIQMELNKLGYDLEAVEAHIEELNDEILKECRRLANIITKPTN